ncbi:substrate-binding domain-containing protein [Streptomyces cacaoi]
MASIASHIQRPRNRSEPWQGPPPGRNLIPHSLAKTIGFDNQELICDGMFPGLTTVALPHYDMGAGAVAQLLALTGTSDREPGPAAQEMLPCPLVARASVASPPRL